MGIPAATRRWLDPSTRDYVVEGGGPRNDDTHASQVVLRATMRLGSCLVRPSLGSRLHTISHDSGPNRRRAESYAHECIADLVRSRAISDVSVAVDVVDLQGSGRGLRITWKFRDEEGDERIAQITKRLGSI